MCSILLVEDHADTRCALETLLHRWGHEVSTADSVAGGIALARGQRFDAIVSDIGLPDGDGCSFLRKVKKTKCRRAVAVALTAWTTHVDRTRAKLAGFHHFLNKPIDLDRLRALLSTVI